MSLGRAQPPSSAVPQITGRAAVYRTPWFELVAKTLETSPAAPFYSLALPDYAAVVAVTPRREVVLVRQYRPAVERHTVELPSGQVDAGETPEASARRELLEETGYVADRMELVGAVPTDTGRMSNRMWCYYAADVKAPAEDFRGEAGIEVMLFPVRDLMRRPLDFLFDHALHLAALFLASGAPSFTGGPDKE